MARRIAARQGLEADDAEDVAQDALTKLTRAMREGGGPQTLGQRLRWLRTTIERDTQRRVSRRELGRRCEELGATPAAVGPAATDFDWADALLSAKRLVPDIVRVIATLRRKPDANVAAALLGQSARRVRACAKLAGWLWRVTQEERDAARRRPPIHMLREAGLSLPESAELLGCTEHALRKRLQRGDEPPTAPGATTQHGRS
jgi:DNA-directed RNA polymerase specialized sigma24 family protein